LNADNCLRNIGGKQRITTPDVYYIPLNIVHGLVDFKLQDPAADEMKSLPHVILTSDQEWDPSCLNNTIDLEQSDWYPKKSEQP
jgi:hypothetical protein